MKKRILALLLMVTMVLSMASCGKDQKTDSKADTKNEEQGNLDVVALFDKIEAVDTKSGEVEINLECKNQDETKKQTVNLEKVGFKLSAVVEGKDSKKASMDLSYRLDDGDYKKLTTFVVDNEIVYVDVEALKSSVEELLNTLGMQQYATVLQMLPQASYVKIDPSQLSQSYPELAGVESATTVTQNVDTEVVEQVFTAGFEYVIKTLQENTKDVTPTLISGSSDSIKVTVTKDNLQATCDVISALDLSAKYDEFVEAIKAVKGSETYVTQLTTKKEQVVKILTEGLTKTKENIGDVKTFDMALESGISGDEGSREVKESVTFDFEDNTGKAKVEVSAVCSEKVPDGKKVIIPENAMDVLDYISSINALFQN